MEGRPMRDFLLGLKWINLLLSLIFEVGRHGFNSDVLSWKETHMLGLMG